MDSCTTPFLALWYEGCTKMSETGANPDEMGDDPDELGGGPNPLDQQRDLMELLSQETRHQIIQFILGHPEHLASEDELNYMVEDKAKKTVTDALDTLVEAGILRVYIHEENKSRRDYPQKFYGPTEYGIDVLGDFNYLRGVPFARAVYEKTRKNSKVERHQEAPRPELPAVVQNALRMESSTGSTATAAEATRPE